MPSICLTICSIAVALPMYTDMQWHLFNLNLSKQMEQIKWPLLQLYILRGGFMSSMQIGQSGIREGGGAERAIGSEGADGVEGAAREEEAPWLEETKQASLSCSSLCKVCFLLPISVKFFLYDMFSLSCLSSTLFFLFHDCLVFCFQLVKFLLMLEFQGVLCFLYLFYAICSLFQG